MPLFPTSTYSSWQLACVAAIEPRGGSHPASLAADAEIRGELRLRGKPDAVVDEMVSLARAVGEETSPFVCMDVDDLERGIAARFEAGTIGATERDRLLAFVGAHVDGPREQRVQAPAGRGKRRINWSVAMAVIYFMLGLGWVSETRSGFRFLVFMAGLIVLIWVQESWPSWRPHRRRPGAG